MHSAPPRTSPALLALVVALLAVLVLTSVSTMTPALAAQGCGAPATHPSGAYQVTVCVTVPDGTLTGDVPVSATVAVTSLNGAPAPAVRRVIFWFDYGGAEAEYLLTDKFPEPGSAPLEFRMTWRTARALAASGVLEARARMADDFVVPGSTPVVLGDAGTAPPNTATWTPRTGTTPQPGQRTRLVAVGDAVDGSPTEEALAAQIASWQPNLLAYLGDVYERGSAYEFDNWYAPGRPGLGQFRDVTNPVVGNHEHLTKGAAGYKQFWGNIPHYYSYDVAGWHIVALDSTAEYDQLRPGTQQFDWLAADLAANRARCTMVYLHHPTRYPAGTGDNTGKAALRQLLADRRVTLVVSGHAHHYERWQPLDGAGNVSDRGVTQLVAGSGGHETTAMVGEDPRLAMTSVDIGALQLDLGADDAQFAFITTNGEVRDAGSIGCKSDGDTLPPTTPTGLLATAISASSARLTWNPSTDQYHSVAGYTVRRNGVVVATLDPSATTFVDTGLVSGQTYSWTVDAFDTSGNYSPQSAPAATTMPAPAPVLISSRKLLRALAVGREIPRGYRASRFGGWTDADGDRCNSRGEVLLAEATRAPTLRAGCRITGGKWYSRYDGVGTTVRARLAIEHLVPLAEAWQSGARNWTRPTRHRFTNDLGYRPSLNVATASVLRARGAAEPHRWLPPKTSVRCTYLAQWVAVKWRWRLKVDRAERRFLVRRLARCGWPQVEQPSRARR